MAITAMPPSQQEGPWKRPKLQTRLGRREQGQGVLRHLALGPSPPWPCLPPGAPTGAALNLALQLLGSVLLPLPPPAGEMRPPHPSTSWGLRKRHIIPDADNGPSIELRKFMGSPGMKSASVKVQIWDSGGEWGGGLWVHQRKHPCICFQFPASITAPLLARDLGRWARRHVCNSPSLMGNFPLWREEEGSFVGEVVAQNPESSAFWPRWPLAGAVITTPWLAPLRAQEPI